MKNKKDWAKSQPHNAKTGKFTTRKYAQKYPNKVEWVVSKKTNKLK